MATPPAGAAFGVAPIYSYTTANYRVNGGTQMNSGAYLYILRCADDSYYVGTTRKTLEERLAEHNAGLHGGFTPTPRPLANGFAQPFPNHTDGGFAETQVKRMARGQKEKDNSGERDHPPQLAE